MSRVLAFVPTEESARGVIDWSLALSDTVDEIEIVYGGTPNDEKIGDAIRDYLSNIHRADIRVRSIIGTSVVSAVVDRCRAIEADYLITPNFTFAPAGQPKQTSRDLVRRSPCACGVVRLGALAPPEFRKLLLIATGGIHDLACLELIQKLASLSNAAITVTIVEDETVDKAEQAGQRALQSLLHDAAVDVETVDGRVVVERELSKGIQACFDDHDLVVVGSDLEQDLNLVEESLQPATLIDVKRAPPLRLRSLHAWLPRIHPSDHADLLQDLRRGSRWGSDFVVMLACASAIASLGLLQNSPAVVIGSMLLAPLMTPIIATGLALAQANARLIRLTTLSIAKGIALTLAVSMVVGILTPSRETLSPEVVSRGEPNVLDLFIALAAAVAATYAMARPSISGAIAGVAIATALVPPLCAAGLAFANGRFGIGLGASLLFATNFVAIVVASSLTFTVMGVSSANALPRNRRAAYATRILLLVTLGIMAGPLSATLIAQLDEGRQQSLGFPVTRRVARALHRHVAKSADIKITFLGRSSIESDPGVILHIASRDEIPDTYSDELRSIVRREMGDPELRVVVIALRGWWRSDE